MSTNTKLIVNANTENINNYRYRDARPFPSGRGKTAKIIGSGGQYQNIQLPKMFCWGVNVNENDSGTPSISINLQFPNEYEQTTAQKRLLEMLKKRDEIHKNTAIEQSQKWFGKKRSEDSIEESYVSCLKYPKVSKDSEERDYSKPPAVRIKIPCYGGVFKCNLFDTNGKPLFNDYIQQELDTFEERKDLITRLIPKTSYLVPIVQSNGLWIVQNNFGETLQLSQAVIKPPERIDNNVCQVVMNDEEIEEINEQKTNTDTTGDEQAHKMDVTVEDSDSSSEHGDNEEVKADEPKPRKRVIRKKK